MVSNYSSARARAAHFSLLAEMASITNSPGDGTCEDSRQYSGSRVEHAFFAILLPAPGVNAHLLKSSAVLPTQQLVREAWVSPVLAYIAKPAGAVFAGNCPSTDLLKGLD